MRILIAEDDTNLRRGLCDLLRLEGFEVFAAECGQSALEAFDQFNPEFCILDINLPTLDGFEVCSKIRARDEDTPVLFLTARTEEIDRVRGFGLGADDYVAKPFSSLELVSRIRAIERRSNRKASRDDQTFQMRDVKISQQASRAYRGEETIELTAREVSVLKLLYDKSGLVVSRDELYDSCWGRTHFANSRALDQLIAGLRRKIEQKGGKARIISTVHGAGYRFDP